MILALTGIGVTAGIAIGGVHRLVPGELAMPEYHLQPDEAEREVRRFHRAVGRVERYLDQVQQRLDQRTGQATVEFLEAHRLMLRDELLFDATCERITRRNLNAEWALSQQHESLLAEFDHMDDEYLAARREDVDQVTTLIQRELADQPAEQIVARIPHRLDDTIIVAPNLTPADLAILHDRGVAGLISEHGSPWSHAAIVASSLEIPTVVGVHRANLLLKEEESIILDGHYGVVLAGGDEALTRHYRDKHADSRRHRAALSRYRARPALTRDGQPFVLLANADVGAEFERARTCGAQGVGLMRTEYLFMRPTLPDEDEQYEAYRAAVELMDGRPVTIRTLDAGGDKQPPDLAMMVSPNPALGLRGLRLSLSMPEIFRQQLRAVLRASAHGPVRLLLPMVTGVAEVRQVRDLLARCREELRAEGVHADPELPLGGMIEVPAAALAVDALLAHLDFLSIGTNDLIQYLLAIDRQDELVSHLYDPLHPAVMQILSAIIASADRADREVSICGELAGDERYCRLLLGMGLKTFSMPPGKMLAVKKALSESDARRCREIIRQYLAGELGEDGDALLQALGEH